MNEQPIKELMIERRKWAAQYLKDLETFFQEIEPRLRTLREAKTKMNQVYCSEKRPYTQVCFSIDMAFTSFDIIAYKCLIGCERWAYMFKNPYLTGGRTDYYFSGEISFEGDNIFLAENISDGFKELLRFGHDEFRERLDMLLGKLDEFNQTYLVEK